MTEREAFERELSSGGRSYGARDEYGYVDSTIDQLWQCWQASRAQALDEAVGAARAELERCGTHLYPDDITYVLNAIRSLTPTKGQP